MVKRVQHPHLIVGGPGRPIAEECQRARGGPLNLVNVADRGISMTDLCGRDSQTRGCIERADGGVLCIEGLEFLPLGLQDELRLLVERGLVQPLWGDPVPVDVQLVCSVGTPGGLARVDSRLRRALVITGEAGPGLGAARPGVGLRNGMREAAGG